MVGANFSERIKDFFVYPLTQSKFDNALESQQRNVAEIVEKDTKEMNSILDEMARLRRTFNETRDIFNLEDFVTKSNAPNVITGNILTVSIPDLIPPCPLESYCFVPFNTVDLFDFFLNSTHLTFLAFLYKTGIEGI